MSNELDVQNGWEENNTHYLVTLRQQYNVGKRSPPLYCTLILITMHSHQSYPNINTVIHSYECGTTVDNSTIETYRNRGLGK